MSRESKTWLQENSGLLIKTSIGIGSAIFLVYILKQTGIIESKKDKADREAREKNATATNSPFNPNYYKGKVGAKLMTKENAITLARKIDDAVGVFSDDESSVYAAFRQLTAKTQVSWLSEIFFQQFGEDLYGFLSDNFNESEMDTVNQIVNSMSEK